jgi:TonB family protein
LSCPSPTYPPAIEARSGRDSVRLEFIVGADGRAEVPSIKVVVASDSRFLASAIAVVRECRFRPGSKAGRDVRTLSVMTIGFTPRQ